MKWSSRQYELFYITCGLLSFLIAKLQSNQLYKDNLMCFGLLFTTMYCGHAVVDAFSSLVDWLVNWHLDKKYGKRA